LQPGLCNDAVAVASAIARLKLRLPNKRQADLWAFADDMPAACKCSISLGRPGTARLINPFSPELSTEIHRRS
jgi:hypothetical protein